MDQEGIFDTYHPHNLGVYVVRDGSALRSDVLEHLSQSLCFHLFACELSIGVIKIEQDCTLVQLPDEELRALLRRRFCRHYVKSNNDKASYMQ